MKMLKQALGNLFIGKFIFNYIKIYNFKIYIVLLWFFGVDYLLLFGKEKKEKYKFYGIHLNKVKILWINYMLVKLIKN